MLVLGASGRVGRSVVEGLLAAGRPVRAFVRDLDRAEVLFAAHLDAPDARGRVLARRGRPPLLTLVEGDLTAADDDDDERNLALENAVRGCDAVVYCAGTVRSTTWRDMCPPWRPATTDVTRWGCHDRTHPYFVHYRATADLLRIVEDEVGRRDRADEEERERRRVREQRLGMRSEEAEEEESGSTFTIVRVSDLCVSLPAWAPVAMTINLLRSMTFRYQAMTDRLLANASSDRLRTVILKPGEFTDEERDPETASLQISSTGVLPSPALVSRADVAELAVAVALGDHGAVARRKGRRELGDASGRRRGSDDEEEVLPPLPPFTELAVRWVGEELSPQPQGRRRQGHRDAAACWRALRRRTDVASSSTRRPIPPHGLCVGVALTIVSALVAGPIARRALAVVAPWITRVARSAAPVARGAATTASPTSLLF